MIFVDTSAWYASSSTRDVNHQAANSVLLSLRESIVTSDYVVDETLTLLRSRNEDQHAIAFGTALIVGSFAQIVRIEEQDFRQAWELFRRYHDKAWSFTDCTSRVIMERLGIQRAFAFDDHFCQFGTVTVLP